MNEGILRRGRVDTKEIERKRRCLFLPLYISVNDDGELFCDFEWAGRYLAREVLEVLRRDYRAEFREVVDNLLYMLRQMIEDIKRGSTVYYKRGKLMIPGFLKDFDIDLLFVSKKGSFQLEKEEELGKEELLNILDAFYRYLKQEL